MSSSNHDATANSFNPFLKEQQLREESTSWNTSNPVEAQDGDIPVIDLQEYLKLNTTNSLEVAADQLRVACEEVGFFSIIGHGVPSTEMQEMFAMAQKFHSLPLDTKQTLLMDRPEWPLGGVGYMPVKNRKLPARDKGNLNEAFIVKSGDDVGMEHNQWPDPVDLPGFRILVEHYASQMQDLGKRLMPIFSVALNMQKDFFEEAFMNPLFRLRMTHYPAVQGAPEDEFGIAPHVDTTFCTILAQDRPGLTIYSERRKLWIKAPLIENAFIVNSGELLRQWTNDRFISVKHFANNNLGSESRYSIPFFLNANPHYKMHCVPSCCSPDNPSKYPAISYAESQGVAQGE
ncbi:MAG: isopenicillin N synthase-like dioxygenase [Parasphingorhabdus sp.]|jgi:isopenicillin N synthase-like dioxygenase